MKLKLRLVRNLQFAVFFTVSIQCLFELRCTAIDLNTPPCSYSCRADGKIYAFELKSPFFEHNKVWNGRDSVPFEVSDAIEAARRGMHDLWNPSGDWVVEEVALKNLGGQNKREWFYVVTFNIDLNKYDVEGVLLPLQIIVDLNGQYLMPYRVTKISTFETNEK